MSRRPTGAELVRTVDRSFTKAMLASNAAGALIVFAFLTFVLPVRHPAAVGRVLALNLPAGVIYGAFAFVFAPRWGRAVARRRYGWLLEERAPTAEEQRAILRNPYAQSKIACALWAVAAVLFGALNLDFGWEVGSEVAAGIVMGGLVTVSISYLVAERALRPMTARALAWGVPLRPVAPGVIARTVLAWAMATGVPMLAIGDVALAMVDGNAPLDHASAWSIVVLALLGLATGAVAIVMAAKSVAEPIRAVRRALAQVEEGVLDVRVEVNDASEVGLLQAGFNRMVAGLQERERLRDLFGRHVGEDVARRALSAGVELGGEVLEAAVLFVDVEGSTQLASSIPAEQVVERLNVFFSIVLDTVHRHGGWVNKFEGDAALCVFGVPTPLEDAAACALAAARELCVRLEAESPLAAGIAVSAGEVVAGNVGAAERYEYTVIGDPVNEAARLTELAKQRRPRIVAAGRAVEQAGVSEAAHWVLETEVVLRGRSSETVVAIPVGAAVPALEHRDGRESEVPQQAQADGPWLA